MSIPDEQELLLDALNTLSGRQWRKCVGQVDPHV